MQKEFLVDNIGVALFCDLVDNMIIYYMNLSILINCTFFDYVCIRILPLVRHSFMHCFKMIYFTITLIVLYFAMNNCANKEY